MTRKAAWIALAALAAVTIYGFFHEDMRDVGAWFQQGIHRFLVFATIFWIWALALIAWRPALLVPLSAIAAAGYSIWWVGFPATLSPIALVGSFWSLGRHLAKRANAYMAVLLGLSAWIFAVSLAVRFPVNKPWVYAVAVALLWLSGWSDVVQAVRAWDWKKRFGAIQETWALRKQTLATAVLLFLLLIHFVVALQPEISADGLAMHLTIPMAVEHEGKWDFDFERFVWALTPMGADWVYTAEYMLGGEAGTKLFNFAMFVLVCGLIRNAARRWVSDTRAALAAALFASTPLVQWLTGNLFVENVSAAIVVGAVLALIDGELVWAGALFGTGLGVKFGTAAFLGPAMVLAATIAVREKKGRQAALGALLLAVLAAPTYLTAWYKTGNPVYPFMNDVFKASSYDTAEPFQDTRFSKPLTWTTPYDLTFRSSDYYEGQRGALGFQYLLLLLPAALFTRRRPLLVLLGITFSAAIIIFVSQPNLRYLYPALALFSIAFVEVPLGWWGMTGLTALNLWFLPVSDWGHRKFALTNRAEVAQFLEEGHPQRKLIEYLNRHAPGEPAAFFDGDPVAGFHGRAYTDQWHTYAFAIFLGRVNTTDDLMAEFRRLGIQYVIAKKSGQTRYPVADQFLKPLIASPLEISREFGLYRIPGIEKHSEPVSVSPHVYSFVMAGDYDDSSKEIEYFGPWTRSPIFPETLHSSISFSNVPGSSLRLKFEGSGIVYWYTRAFNRGIALIRIDGTERARLDLYSKEIQWRQSTRFDGLTRGRHTMDIQVLDQRNPAATDGHVDLDQLTVLP